MCYIFSEKIKTRTLTFPRDKMWGIFEKCCNILVWWEGIYADGTLLVFGHSQGESKEDKLLMLPYKGVEIIGNWVSWRGNGDILWWSIVGNFVSSSGWYRSNFVDGETCWCFLFCGSTFRMVIFYHPHCGFLCCSLQHSEFCSKEDVMQ